MPLKIVKSRENFGFQVAWIAFSVNALKTHTPSIDHVKGIVHPKMKMLCLFAYPQGIQDVDDFVFSVEHKQRFLTQTVAVCQSGNAS